MTTATKTPTLSQSRQHLLACPHLYRVSVIEGRAEADNQYAARGREIHDVLYEYVIHLVETEQQSDLDRFDELLASAMSGDAHDILEAMRGQIAIDPEQVLCAERRFYLDDQFEPITEDLDAEARAAYDGKPDLVLLIDETTAKIPDYKSHWQITDADTFQGRQYATLIFCHFPFVETVIFELQFVRYGGTVRQAQYTRDQLPMLKKTLERERKRQLFLHSLGENDIGLQAMPGDHCAYCPLLHSGCPVAEVNPMVNQSPEDRLRFELWATAALRVNTAALQAHVNASGPVTIEDGNGQRYTRHFRLKDRVTFPLMPVVKAIEEWLAQHPDDTSWVHKLAIRATKLKGYLKTKKRAALKQRIDEEVFTETYTQWHLEGGDRPEEDEEEERDDK